VLTGLVYGSTPRFGGAIPSLSERPSRNGNPSHGLRGLIHSTSLTIFDIRPVLLGGSADAFDHVCFETFTLHPLGSSRGIRAHP
jgi:hypothetical protein